MAIIDVDVSLRSSIHLQGPLLEAVLDRILQGVGEGIITEAKEHMTPGHFYDSGVSHDTAAYTSTGHLTGEATIPTPYAAYPELGTVFMEPRPVLRPAVDRVWPALVYTLAKALP